MPSLCRKHKKKAALLRSLLIVLYSLFFVSVPVFSQTAVREQGLITADPFWRQALGGEVMSLPSVQAQSAVVALDGGNIRAYSASGLPLWNFSARGRISPYVTRSREGTSYITRTNGTLIAVNRAGRELWRRNLDEPLSSHVIVGWDGRLFAPVEKKIFCFTASGNLLWTLNFESPFTINPKLDRSGGILLAMGNNVRRVDQFGNIQSWTLPAPPVNLFLYKPVTDPGAQQQIMALYPDGTLEIVGSNQDWYIGAQTEGRTALLPRLPARPLAAAERESNVAVVMNDGRVALVSTEERKILWLGNSHIREMINSGRQEIEAELIFDERGIYVLSRGGATCFSQEGRRYWFTFLQNAASIPAFGDDGVLYSGGRDWILYAYKLEDRILSHRNIYGREPEGSYGLGRPQSFYTPNVPLFEDEVGIKIDKINAAIHLGKVGADEPEWTTFLLTLSAGKEELEKRLSAISLLGKIGSRETVPWLLNIYNNENEPVLKTAAITAIGEIGVDPAGNSLQTFLFSIIQGKARNEQVLAAIAAATGALCRFSGPPLSETGVRILNLLSAASQPSIVRSQAEKELKSLR